MIFSLSVGFLETFARLALGKHSGKTSIITNFYITYVCFWGIVLDITGSLNNKKGKGKYSCKARLTDKIGILIGNFYLFVRYRSYKYCIISKEFTFSTKDFVTWKWEEFSCKPSYWLNPTALHGAWLWFDEPRIIYIIIDFNMQPFLIGSLKLSRLKN